MRMQRFEGGHQICRVWAQVFPLGGHVPTPLYYLTNQLVLREADSNAVERRPAPASNAVERMAVVALLRLKNKNTAALQSCTSLQILGWDRVACIRVRRRSPSLRFDASIRLES